MIHIIHKARFPFLRPSEFAKDESSGIAPILHALEQFPEVEQVLLLQPTSPLRTTADIDGIFRMCQEAQAPAAVSICEPSKHSNWMFSCGKDGILSPFTDNPIAALRQDLPKVYWRNGQVYVTKKEVLFKTNDLYGEKSLPYIMNDDYPVNIDNLIDFKFAEYLVSQKNIDFDIDFIKSEYERHL